VLSRSEDEIFAGGVIPVRASVGRKPASWKPDGQRPQHITRTVDLDQAGAPRRTEIQLSQVDACDGFEIGTDDYAIAEAGVGVTKIRVSVPQHQPVPFGLALELKPDDLPARRQLVGGQVLEDAPHQEVGVELLPLQLEPLLPPDPQAADHLGQLRLAGMTLRERWSDWNREPFTSDSRSHVSVWQKAE